MQFHSTQSYTRLARVSALYDLAMTWPLMTPISVGWLYAAIGALHGAMDLPAPVLPDAHAMMFTNFAGSVVVIWSTARLIVRDLRLTRLDAVARWLFSLWMAVALLAGASPILYVLIVIELAFAVIQSLPVTHGPDRAKLFRTGAFPWSDARDGTAT